jgi:hypothetical protein
MAAFQTCLFSANGAVQALAWGNAPGFQIAYRASAESSTQRDDEIAPSALILCIDRLPRPLPNAEDECCAFGAKQILSGRWVVLERRPSLNFVESKTQGRRIITDKTCFT